MFRGMPMPNRLAVTLAMFLCGIAGPAASLSCAYLDAAAMYQQAADASERYVIVHGAFLRNGPDVPLTPVSDDPDTPPPYSVEMLFYGDLGSRVGFHTPVELEVTVRVNCVLSWCGAPPEEGREVLAFLRVDEDRAYHLGIGPCPGWVIYNPSQQDLDQIVACMRGETCEPGE